MSQSQLDSIGVRHKRPKTYEQWLEWVALRRSYYVLPTGRENRMMAYRRYLRLNFDIEPEEVEDYQIPGEEGGMKLKNVAAVLNEDATTISCRFGGSDKEYVYRVTQAMAQRLRDFQKDYKGTIKVVSDDLKDPTLVAVHDEALIDLESNTNYRWVVGILTDWDIHEAKKKEKKILDGLQNRQRITAKDQVLRSFGIESVQQLLGNDNEKAED